MKDTRSPEAIVIEKDVESDDAKATHVQQDSEVFGNNEEGNGIRYRTLSWQYCACLMTAEIVSNGMLSLPYTLAQVGIVPAVILIIFLGVFATYTSYLLIAFKLRHPSIHSMGDAGYLMFGVIGREIFAAGTFLFAVLACGSQLLAGQIALASLSDSKLCLMLYTGIFSVATLFLSLPRTFDRLSWLSVPACGSILIAGIVGMIGAGVYPIPGRTLSVANETTFYNAFTAVVSPTFAFAGHFMFFVIISEMKRPQDAMKAAYALQIFATSFYVVFAVVMYVYIGPTVASPAFSSLPPRWQKAAFGLLLPNLLVAGALYSHTASKLYFVRLFRTSRHLHEHTLLGWSVWVGLILLCNAAAFVLAVGVPIFNYVVGLGASLFAAWYTYGIAGGFLIFDLYHDDGGWTGLRRHWKKTTLGILTFISGAFISVAGLYVTIRGIVDAYHTGMVMKPFSC